MPQVGSSTVSKEENFFYFQVVSRLIMYTYQLHSQLDLLQSPQLITLAGVIWSGRIQERAVSWTTMTVLYGAEDLLDPTEQGTLMHNGWATLITALRIFKFLSLVRLGYRSSFIIISPYRCTHRTHMAAWMKAQRDWNEVALHAPSPLGWLSMSPYTFPIVVQFFLKKNKFQGTVMLASIKHFKCIIRRSLARDDIFLWRHFEK